MSLSINNSIKAGVKIIGSHSFAGTLTINAASSVPLRNIPGIIQAQVKAAAVAVPQTCPPLGATTGMSLLGSAGGLVITHDVAGLSGGFPINHLAAAGGADGIPLDIVFGSAEDYSATSQLVVSNPTAGNLDLHVLVYSDT